MPEQLPECRKFDADLEIRMVVEVVEGSPKKFHKGSFRMLQKTMQDLLSVAMKRSGFEKFYGDGMKLKMHVIEVECTFVGENHGLDEDDAE